MAETIIDKINAMVSISEIMQHFGGLKLGPHGKAKCPFHTEKTGSLSVMEKENFFKCFGCDAKGDAIDFVRLIKGVDNKEAIRLVAEFYRIDSTPHGGISRVDNKLDRKPLATPNAPHGSTSQITEAQKKLNADYLRRCSADRGADDYLRSRGFTDETIARFCLGYDRKRDAAVIPYTDGVLYYTARKLHPKGKDDKHLKPLKDEFGAAPLWGEKALDGAGVVFVVESQTCAISIAQAGGTAVGLGGNGYAGLLIREIEKRDGCKQIIFALSLDNDDGGRTTQAKLAEQMRTKGIRFFERRVQGDDPKINDPNELLIADAEALRANIQTATEEAGKAAEIPKTENKEQQVLALLSRDISDNKVLYTTEYLEALAYAKQHLYSDYLAFKNKAKEKRGFSVKDFEGAVDTQIRKGKKQATTDEPPLDLGRSDMAGIVTPKGWTVTLENGVRKTVSTRDGEKEVIACPDAVIISAYLKNADDGTWRMEVSFFSYGAWVSLIDPKTKFFNKNTLPAYADQGFRVSSETARDMVNYFMDYDRRNNSAIPVKKSLSRVGWIGTAEFFPFATDEEVVYEENKGASIFHGLREHGDYAEWKEMMTKLRKNKFARFLTSSSFASPLIVKMGVRPFAIHIWHDSASGKSAVLKAAISIWGNPQRVMGTAFTTQVGLEQRAGTLNNLPLGIDEKQAADENKTPLSKIVYMLGEGEGKTRGAKSGGNQETVTWHNIAIITGEEPITSTSSKDGVQTRTLELNGRPVDEIEFAQAVHKTAENNYGYAGTAFMRAICKVLKSDGGYLEKRYADTYAALKAKGHKGVHAEFVAAVIVADYLAETLIFGTDAETAERESFEVGTAIFKHNEEQLHCDNIQSAYDFVVGWIISNESRFSSEFQTPLYGKMKDCGEYRTKYYVIEHQLIKALEEAGYNAGKIIRGFFERGHIEKEYRGGVYRNKHQTYFKGGRADTYCFELIKKEKPPKQTTIADLQPIENDENLPF